MKRDSNGMVGESVAMKALARRIDRVAGSALPVLIRGETGTGKELVARAVHARSTRAAHPFVSENCAALAETLLEAELFGHERGAFTDARQGRDGLFAQADGGSLFLDEVGEMSLAMQAKLLRVLQEGEVRRLGGSQFQSVDVRVIAATHKDLEAEVESGRFRADLFYRLAVLMVPVPPLRQRMADLPLLVEHFLERLAAVSEAPRLSFSPGVIRALQAHSWPGNVRELENAVRVAALEAHDGELDLRSWPRQASELDEGLSYTELLEQQRSRERRYVAGALARAEGIKTEAARALGISRYALYRTLRRLGVEAPRREVVALRLDPSRRKTA